MIWEEAERTSRADVIRVLVGANLRVEGFDSGGHGGRMQVRMSFTGRCELGRWVGCEGESGRVREA